MEEQQDTTQKQEQSQKTKPTDKTTGEDPGKTLGIVSLITSLIGLGLIGLIVGIIGRKKSKEAGFKNGLALAGIIIGIINIVLVLVAIVVIVFVIGSAVQTCNELGPGTHFSDGVTYTCW